jgi:uncharacterized membrane-anchored protein
VSICLFTLTFFVEFLHSDIAWHPSIIHYILLFHFKILLWTVVCSARSLIVSFSWIVTKFLLLINKLGKSTQNIVLEVCSLCCLWSASSVIISRKTLKCPFHVFHNRQYKTNPYCRNRFTTDNKQHFGNVCISWTLFAVIDSWLVCSDQIFLQSQLTPHREYCPNFKSWSCQDLVNVHRPLWDVTNSHPVEVVLFYS